MVPTNSCPHHHSRHTHIWLLGDEEPYWVGLIENIGLERARYEPCPETDPGRAPEGEA